MSFNSYAAIIITIIIAAVIVAVKFGFMIVLKVMIN